MVNADFFLFWFCRPLQEGLTALSYALEEKHVEVAAVLLERGADPDLLPEEQRQGPIFKKAAQQLKDGKLACLVPCTVCCM